MTRSSNSCVPVPPLALIPLVIIWFGIGETGKIILLFLAALWIMAIAARSGVSGVNIAKVHAAYSLGASKWQIMRSRHHSELAAGDLSPARVLRWAYAGAQLWRPNWLLRKKARA